MSNGSNIEQRVMANVAAIYAARKATSRLALECYAFVLSLCGAAFFVSLPHVAQNFAHVTGGGVASVGLFLVSAVLQTKLVVQVALLVGALSLVAFGIDISRSTSARSRMAM